ncbi:YtxH domain-containing protein [Paenibacillus psychroresistens]|uniref:YtxH domain-containing protein n=1 Tax=Paenibacillus psychroresistens TaxID=1778678 RepID=A0A6B8RPJ0_9BACL|nr:YtxH domain-containing protein [Paenibacillus psychroresistens]QGQ98281.1 YtxH domain-containing protein [Paenibacillus psychroresistens]
MSIEAKNNSGFWQGILIGGAVATVSALLYAPKAGKQVRSTLTTLFRSLTQAPVTATGQAITVAAPQTINSMAQNETEMAKLGREMKHMQTNTQVKDSGMVPDPIQNE